jgi:hypothetical protein
MKRAVPLAALWIAAAAAAVGLGFLAVSLVDASGAPATPLVTATSTASPSTSAPSKPARQPAIGDFATVAGTAYANCSSGGPVVAGAPAAGWWVDDSSSVGKVEFQNGDHHLEVRVACVDGSPRFTSEGAEDRPTGSPSAAPSSSPSSGSPASTPAAPTKTTDHPGGGHGADDPAGDDSSGRNGGGHGSDG